MECLLWVRTLIYDQPQSPQWYMQCHGTLDDNGTNYICLRGKPEYSFCNGLFVSNAHFMHMNKETIPFIGVFTVWSVHPSALLPWIHHWAFHSPPPPPSPIPTHPIHSLQSHQLFPSIHPSILCPSTIFPSVHPSPFPLTHHSSFLHLTH